MYCLSLRFTLFLFAFPYPISPSSVPVRYTPTYRGFDTHLGYWGGVEDYVHKNRTYAGMKGHDFRNGLEACSSEEYSTYLYGNETLRILTEHVEDEKENPFFLYFASQAVHSPFVAPDEVIQSFDALIGDPYRREMAAVATVLDDTVGQIVEYLKSEESGYLWDNTLFIVSSDNGGDQTISQSNFPLRGSKGSLWEGGVKALGFVTGGYLPDTRRSQHMNALMHISDWYPTLCTLVGIDPAGPDRDQVLLK